MAEPSPVPDRPIVRSRPRDRKQQILLSARDLFASVGYPNVSMSQIADEVGITAGALYRHFDNKATLLEGVFEECFAWLAQPLRSEELGEIVEEGLRSVSGQPYLADLWIHERRHLAEPVANSLGRRMVAWIAPLRSALAAARPGLTSGELTLLVAAVQSALSCVGRRSIHVARLEREPCVTGAIHAIIDVALQPASDSAEVDPPRRRPVSMREQLLLAASEQFGRIGYHQTSIASIGASVGVTGASLYGYFESKADLLRAVHDRGLHALWLSLDDALAVAPDAGTAFAMACASFVRIARSWAATLDDTVGEVDAPPIDAQREFVAELVALLQEVRPDIDQREARLRVQIALIVVADLYRDVALAEQPGFQRNATQLMVAITLHERAG